MSAIPCCITAALKIPYFFASSRAIPMDTNSLWFKFFDCIVQFKHFRFYFEFILIIQIIHIIDAIMKIHIVKNHIHWI